MILKSLTFDFRIPLGNKVANYISFNRSLLT
jgi:hypothetical protein